MLTIDKSVAIAKSRKEVWDYITNPDNMTLWNGNFDEYDADWDDEPKAGDSFRLVQRVAGRRIEMAGEVSEVTPAEVWANEITEAPFPASNRITLEDVQDGTKVSFHAETPGLGGFFGKLTEPVVAKMFGRQVQSNLDNLKTLLEEAT